MQSHRQFYVTLSSDLRYFMGCHNEYLLSKINGVWMWPMCSMWPIANPSNSCSFQVLQFELIIYPERIQLHQLHKRRAKMQLMAKPSNLNGKPGSLNVAYMQHVAYCKSIKQLFIPSTSVWTYHLPWRIQVHQLH